MVDANQIVYQDESYPLEVCAEITYIGSNPVLTTKKTKKDLVD
jgi:hypothetical protein